jgi:hypothetical protein
MKITPNSRARCVESAAKLTDPTWAASLSARIIFKCMQSVVALEGYESITLA